MLTGVFMLSAMLLAGCDSGGSNEEEPSGAEVAVAEDNALGEYLADEDGLSLYLFVDEEGNPAPCTTDDCLAAWPPFTTEGDPVAGEGIDASLLSTTEGPNGTTQVVYNGWPLWYFVNDGGPGDVNGHGIVSFGGTWLLVSPAGEAIDVPGGEAQVTVAENDELGEYLADGEGLSLYLFTDGEGNPVSCTGGCVENWPVFTTEGDPIAGDGVDAALVSTTERSDGTIQVVYNDWPLYYFAGDEAPGDVNGQGLGPDNAKWYLISPAGEAIQGAAGSSNGDTGGGGDPGDDPGY